MAKETKEKEFEKLEVERFRIQKAKVKAQKKENGNTGTPVPLDDPLAQKVVATTTEAILKGDESIIKIRKKRLPEAKKAENQENTIKQEYTPTDAKKPGILPGINDYSTSEEDD